MAKVDFEYIDYLCPQCNYNFKKLDYDVKDDTYNCQQCAEVEREKMRWVTSNLHKWAANNVKVKPKPNIIEIAMEIDRRIKKGLNRLMDAEVTIGKSEKGIDVDLYELLDAIKVKNGGEYSK